MVVISWISAAAMAMRLSHPHAFVALVCFFLAGACLFREKKERKFTHHPFFACNLLIFKLKIGRKLQDVSFFFPCYSVCSFLSSVPLSARQPPGNRQHNENGHRYQCPASDLLFELLP